MARASSLIAAVTGADAGLERVWPSTALRVWMVTTAARGPRRAPRATAGMSRLVERHDRPHLDAAEARRRNLRSDLDRVVQVLGVDHIKPAQLLLRLGEGAVGGRD